MLNFELVKMRKHLKGQDEDGKDCELLLRGVSSFSSDFGRFFWVYCWLEAIFCVIKSCFCSVQRGDGDGTRENVLRLTSLVVGKWMENPWGLQIVFCEGKLDQNNQKLFHFILFVGDVWWWKNQTSLFCEFIARNSEFGRCWSSS